MRGIGSGENGELTFLDVLAIVSFCVGLENFDMNITQEDMQKTAAEIDDDIHAHLAVQDIKLNHIIKLLEGMTNDR